MMRRRAIGRPVARAVGVAATTAVVAGTAGAVRHHQEQKYAQQAAANQPQQVVYEAPPPAGSEIDDQLIQIQKLSSMKDQGLITEEEFQANKKQILGI